MNCSSLAESLEEWAWKVSEAIQCLDKCPHASKGHADGEYNHLCVACMNLKSKLGVLPMHLASNPDSIFTTEIKVEARELLNILRDACSVSYNTSGDAIYWLSRSSLLIRRLKQWPRLSNGRKRQVQKTHALVNGESQDALHRGIRAYLKQPRFVIEGLSGKCEELIQKLSVDESDDEMDLEELEPEDHSRAHNALFPALRKYSRCKSCSGSQTPEQVVWHQVRLFLMGLPKSDAGMVDFDIITSPTTGDWWQELSITASTTTIQRVAFAGLDTEVDIPRLPTPNTIDAERLDRFCQILEKQDLCRMSLKLENKMLFRLGAEALKHPTLPGQGLSLANVLENYTLSVKEKVSLAYSIALAVWRFYDSQLMNRAWSSKNIWFMPEPDPRDGSQRLPLRAYISFHPDTTECDFDASEFINTNSVIHRCPRIQALAVLLLEIGLSEPLQYPNSDHETYRLNYIHSKALQWLKELKSTEWENFSHKHIYTDAVRDCLTFDGLTGKEVNTETESSNASRRASLYQQVVARLEWLNKSFHGWNNEIPYLSAKQTEQEAVQISRSTSLLTKTSTWTTIDSECQVQVKVESCIKTESSMRPTDRHGFEVLIICALTIEFDAVEALFDCDWEEDGQNYGRAPGDTNAYSTGLIGRHNVVVTHLSRPGKKDAATAAANCKQSFPDIKIALVVGICGAVPHVPGTREEIILGDVIVSEGIIEYDFGRRFPEGFTRKTTPSESLGPPSSEIRSLLGKLKSNKGRKKLRKRMYIYLEEIQKELGAHSEYPIGQDDKLFEARYRHIGDTRTCEEVGCRGNLVFRHRISQGATQPAIHFGLLASGDAVMRSGEERDSVAKAERIVGFEMEGAGVWDVFPSVVVIKSACDYADSHKTKVWQSYAAATAAACTKSFLDDWKTTMENGSQRDFL